MASRGPELLQLAGTSDTYGGAAIGKCTFVRIQQNGR